MFTVESDYTSAPTITYTYNPKIDRLFHKLDIRNHYVCGGEILLITP